MSTTQSLVCYGINGWNGNMFQGPQAEVGLHLAEQGLAYFQPVGYNSSGLPLSNGVKAGLAEFQRLRKLRPGPYLVTAWSEGAVIATAALQAELAAGVTDCKGGAFYGNPYRAAGQWNPTGSALGAVPDPGGAGVGGPGHNWKTPDFIHHYCHGPNKPSYDGITGTDLYTCCSTGVDGDIARIFYNFVFAQWTGGFEEIFVIAKDFAANTGMTLFAALKTAIQWIEFYAKQTAPHQNYTSYAGAAYLANVARTLP